MNVIPFRKMHGLGNDFVVLDARESPIAMTPQWATRIACRRRGVGCDQLILIENAHAETNAKLRFWNSDGSASDACGNGARCIAGLLLRETAADRVALATAAGVLACTRGADGAITVDMGAPRLGWRDIPLAHETDTLSFTVDVRAADLPSATAVNMGNPHAIFFLEPGNAPDLSELGPLLERHPLFPERANIGFARIAGEAEIGLNVWERGAGLTLACGTAACAAVVAASRRGLIERKARVNLPGGPLDIEWRASDGHVLMTGAWSQSFEGVLSHDIGED